MTIWHGIIGFLAAYILLLGRSAWIQGEFKQFLRSLTIVLALVTGIVGVATLLGGS